MKKLLLLLLILVGNSYGANKYLRQGATGTGSGNDWTNAYTTLGALETGLARGDTGYIADTTTGLPGATFNTAASGTTVITLKKATVADHGTDTGWSDAYGDGQAVFSSQWLFNSRYWTVDGVTGGGPPAAGGGNTSWTTGFGIRINGGSSTPVIFVDNGGGDVHVSHVELVGVPDGTGSGAGNDAFQMGFNVAGPCSLSYAYAHDMGRCMFFFAGNGTETMTISYCYFGDFESTGGEHSEFAILRGTGKFTMRWSIITDIADNSTGGVIAGDNGASTAEVYGNVFVRAAGATWMTGSNGMLAAFTSGSAQTNWKVYNNTMVNVPSGCPIYGVSGQSPSGNQARNNYYYLSTNAGVDPGWTQSYDHFQNSGSVQGTNGTSGSGDPFVGLTTYNFRLNSNTTAGTPLAAPYNIDMYGNTRSTWTRGAVEFAAAGDQLPAISSATINAAGTQVTIAFSEAIQVGAGGWNGWVLNLSGGNITIPAQTPSGSGTTRTYTFSSVRIVGQGETGSIVYTQPGNGIEDSALQDLPTGSTVPVTNNSTVPTTAAPSFSPAAGSYFGTQNVIMTSSTPGATIRYTTDGTDPTASSTQYAAGATGIPTSAFTSYKAKAFAGGFLDSSITSAAYEVGTWVSGAVWKNFVVPQQTGTFTWSFRARASSTASGGLIGLAPNTSAAQADLAHIVRFSPTGTIEARNNTAFAAVNTFNYTADTDYSFVCTVNLAASTYSLTVSQIGGSPIIIANNYTNNATAIGITEVDNVGISVPTTGTVTVSQMSFGTVAGTIPVLTGATIGASGTNLTLVFDVPVNYGTGGNGGWTISASGGAATLTPSASPTSFTISRSIAIGESVTVSYVQPGDGVEATTGGGDMLSRSGFGVSNQSTVDLTAPVPNPSTFSIVPTATGTTTITMTATTSTDANSGPVQYFFNETSGNAGGSDSGWQTSPTFTDTGLAAGTQYTYRVRTRDSASTPNMTSFSNSASATTQSVAGAHPASPFNVARANLVMP